MALCLPPFEDSFISARVGPALAIPEVLRQLMFGCDLIRRRQVTCWIPVEECACPGTIEGQQQLRGQGADHAMLPSTAPS